MSTLRRFTAVIEREGDGYIAICPEFDVASQGDTVEEARANLTEALTLFLETADASEIDRRFRPGVFVTQVEVRVR
jgi:predicted RNase H-like HicB family nuclease